MTWSRNRRRCCGTRRWTDQLPARYIPPRSSHERGMSEETKQPGLPSSDPPIATAVPTPTAAAPAAPGAATAAPVTSRARAPSFVAHTIEEIPAADGAALLADMPPHEAAQVAEFLD